MKLLILRGKSLNKKLINIVINEHSDSGHDDEHNNEDNPSQQAALSNTILIDTNRLR